MTKGRIGFAFVVVGLLGAGAWAQTAETVMENDPSLPWHTVYRPADVSAAGV